MVQATLPRRPPRQQDTLTVVCVQISHDHTLQMTWDVFPHLEGHDPIADREVEGDGQIEETEEALGVNFNVARAVVSAVEEGGGVLPLQVHSVLSESGAKVAEGGNSLLLDEGREEVGHVGRSRRVALWHGDGTVGEGQEYLPPVLVLLLCELEEGVEAVAARVGVVLYAGVVASDAGYLRGVAAFLERKVHVVGDFAGDLYGGAGVYVGDAVLSGAAGDGGFEAAACAVFNHVGGQDAVVDAFELVQGQALCVLARYAGSVVSCHSYGAAESRDFSRGQACCSPHGRCCVLHGGEVEAECCGEAHPLEGVDFSQCYKRC